MTPESDEPLAAAGPAEAPVAETVAGPADAEAGAEDTGAAEAAEGDHPGDIPFEQAVVEHENPALG
ncbi:hypothetical protein [Leifsonia sp. EB34]|uniref:hypothetical protein n=1 Tax=Leifsonia sp. EB34 TaxID=3156303 RepID=UPI0035191358